MSARVFAPCRTMRGVDDADRLIRQLRAQGVGWHTIAATLNARGVATRSGAGRWWPASARNAADPAGWAAYMRRWRKAKR